VDALIAALTLDDKIQQISTFTPKTVPGVSRIGLPPFSYHSEGLHGLRNADVVGKTCTIFPQTTGMAANGNLSMIRSMGEVMGAEARALDNIREAQTPKPIFGRGAGLFYWSPTMNLGTEIPS
jgi:beta-glucosidase-like glycosyl hydrolase